MSSPPPLVSLSTFSPIKGRGKDETEGKTNQKGREKGEWRGNPKMKNVKFRTVFFSFWITELENQTNPQNISNRAKILHFCLKIFAGNNSCLAIFICNSSMVLITGGKQNDNHCCSVSPGELTHHNLSFLLQLILRSSCFCCWRGNLLFWTPLPPCRKAAKGRSQMLGTLCGQWRPILVCRRLKDWYKRPPKTLSYCFGCRFQRRSCQEA